MFFGAFLGPILAVLLFNLFMMIVVVTVLVRHMRNTIAWAPEGADETKDRLQTVNQHHRHHVVVWTNVDLWCSDHLWCFAPFPDTLCCFQWFPGLLYLTILTCLQHGCTYKLWKESLSSSYNKFSTLQRSHKGAGTCTISTGDTKKLQAVAGTFALTSISDRESEQPILSVTSDHEVSINPSDFKDETPMPGGDNLIIKGDYYALQILELLIHLKFNLGRCSVPCYREAVALLWVAPMKGMRWGPRAAVGELMQRSVTILRRK